MIIGKIVWNKDLTLKQADSETTIYRRPLELGLGHLNAFDGDKQQIERLQDT